MDQELIGLLVALAVVFLVFLIIRAIILWYWRVNEGIALLESIDNKLTVLTSSDEKLALLVNEALKKQ